MSLINCLIVMLGGALGTLARYVIAYLAAPISDKLPVGTILINISGSFVIGFFGALTLAGGRYPAPEGLRLFVMVGLCGGYTTFSAFSLQTLELMRSGALGRAGVNIIASVTLSIAAVALGYFLATYLNPASTHVAQIAIEEDA